MTELTQQVGYRLRKNHLCAGGVRISLRDSNLSTKEYQMNIPFPIDHTEQIASYAIQLLEQHRWTFPIRSASVGVFRLSDKNTPVQLHILYDAHKEEKKERLEQTVDSIRERFGAHSVHSASYLYLTGSDLFTERPGWNPAFSLGEGQRDLDPSDGITFT